MPVLYAIRLLTQTTSWKLTEKGTAFAIGARRSLKTTGSNKMCFKIILFIFWTMFVFRISYKMGVAQSDIEKEEALMIKEENGQ